MPTKPSKPIIDKPSKEMLKDLIRPYSDEEINNPKDKREKNLKKLYKEHGIKIETPKTKHMSFLPEDKKAYPNYDQYMYIPNQRDTKKWLLALKDIKYKQRAGLPYKEAIKASVQSWNKMEIFDFLNWMKFYEEGAPMKYKFAQVWYENGQPGYFLHIKPDAQKEPEPVVDSNPVRDAEEEAARQEEKRSTIEKQRSKIIGRLDSAEKLLRSPEGQQFAGTELEQLMEAIYTLKKKVQLVNKLSVSTRLYEDMIVREGNVLKRQGLNKAAAMLYSLAQSPGQSGQAATGQQYGGKVPMDVQPPADPSGAGQSGMPNGYVNLSVNDPSQPNNVNEFQPSLDAFSADAPPPPPGPPASPGGVAPPPPPPPPEPTAPVAPPQPKGIKEFIQNMNEGPMTNEVAGTPDQLHVSDEDDLEVNDREEELMVTEAQVAPIAPPGVPPAALEDVPITDDPPPAKGDPANLPPPSPDAPDAPKGPKGPKAPGGADEEPLTVTEDDIPPGGTGGTGFTTKMDEMLKGVTVADIVAELEDISKDYKTRSQPRRLSKVDMMLDSVGLASMFPSLSEAQNKALEANNYISTRVDDILSKLRGAMAGSEKPAGAALDRPEIAGIKGKLQSDQDKEKQRKQMRKEQEASELEGGAGKETPQVEMGELAPPAAPAAPPVTPPPLPAPPPRAAV